MTELFNRCIEVVLKHEGGFQRDPDDSGNWVGGYKTGTLVGTNFGIAAKFFPEEDILHLTKQRAKDLFYEYFWKPSMVESIENEELVLELLDFGINSGNKKIHLKRAIIILQSMVGASADGIIGPKTRKAIQDYGPNVVDHYKVERIFYYIEVSKKRDNSKFLQGWLRRVTSTHF